MRAAIDIRLWRSIWCLQGKHSIWPLLCKCSICASHEIGNANIISSSTKGRIYRAEQSATAFCEVYRQNKKIIPQRKTPLGDFFQLLNQTQKIILQVFLVGSAICQIFERFAQLGEISILREDFAFHSVSISEWNAF